MMRLAGVLLVALPAVLALSCDDRQPVAEARCESDRDCPGGQRCIDALCVDQVPCELGCCALESCQAGFCAAAPTDDCAPGCPDPDFDCLGDYCVRRACEDDSTCNGARCVAGFCVRGLPCGGCDAGEACFPHRDLCRPAPASCRETCGIGEVAVVLDADAYNGPQCTLEAATCACIGPPPITSGGDVRQVDMAVLRGAPVFVGYDPDFGDLIFIEGLEAPDGPTVTFVDGVPDVGPIEGDVGGPRGGRVEPGPDRGRYARVAVDGRNRVHAAYYDLDEGDLRYALRSVDGTWTTTVVDAEGDVGRYVRLDLDAGGRAHLVYSVVETVDGRSGVRYAVARVDAPASPDDFTIAAVSTRFDAVGETAAPGVLPERHGVRPCFQLTADGTAVVAFHDGTEQALYLARGGLDGFEVFPLDGRLTLNPAADPGGRYADLLTHPLGAWCDLVAGEAGVQVVFTDELTWSLLAYRGPVEGGGDIEVVDPGGDGQRRRVGVDPALALDGLARPVVIYQDATDNLLRMAVRGPGGWIDPIVVDADGPTGFANALVVQDEEALIGTLSLSSRSGGRVAADVRVLRVRLP